jgi:hypothetical protein
MKVGLLLFPAMMLLSGVAIAQEDDQPAPSSHPPGSESLDAPVPEPKHEDCPFLSRYGRANQMKYIIEPDIDFGSVNGQVNIGIAPAVGHKIWKGLYAGAGAVFIYSGARNVLLAELNNQLYFVNANRYTYGGGAYVQYDAWKGLYVRVRFDLLHRQIDDLDNATAKSNPVNGSVQVNMPVLKMNIPDMPVSVGYNVLVKKKLFFPISLSYNALYPFLDKRYSVYPNGWIVTVGMFNIF